jgi:hypothetical protein
MAELGGTLNPSIHLEIVDRLWLQAPTWPVPNTSAKYKHILSILLPLAKGYT